MTRSASPSLQLEPDGRERKGVSAAVSCNSVTITVNYSIIELTFILYSVVNR